MRIVDDRDGLTPMERLELTLTVNPGLDGLYAQTLSCSSHFPLFHTIMAALTIWDEPLTIQTLAHFLDTPEHKVIDVLVPLQAIVQVPGDNTTPVTFFHTSLVDFLKDPRRAENLHVNFSALEDFVRRMVTRAFVPENTEELELTIRTTSLRLWNMSYPEPPQDGPYSPETFASFFPEWGVR